MRRFVAVVSCLLGVVFGSWGAEYRLTNGDVLRGEPASYNDDGLIVRREVGGFSQRIGWGKLTQETLKQLAEIPEAQPFVEPYIEIPIEEKQRRKAEKKVITVREPPQVEQAAGGTSFFAALVNPIGLFVLGVLYLANLYAGLEVARFRGRSPGLVVGISAILPILGPLIFALLPSSGAAEAAPAPVEQPAPEPAAAASKPAASGGLGLSGGGAPASPAAANPAYGQVYNRSNTTFDRRFFETKFTGFFRVVPAEAEKDLVLVVKAAKAEYIAKRISRISMNEMHLQLQRGNEVSVPFGEVMEVAVRHKDAK